MAAVNIVIFLDLSAWAVWEATVFYSFLYLQTLAVWHTGNTKKKKKRERESNHPYRYFYVLADEGKPLWPGPNTYRAWGPSTEAHMLNV